MVAEILADKTSLSPATLREGFLEGSPYGSTSISHGAALTYVQRKEIDQPHLVMAHCQSGTSVRFDSDQVEHADDEPCYALFFLLSPKDDEGEHLHTLANIANRTNEEQFLVEWRAANDDQEIKETLLHHDRYLTLRLLSNTDTEELIGKRLDELTLPAGLLVTVVRRDGELLVPRAETTLEEGDRVTIIGETPGIQRLRELYDMNLQ